MADLDLDVHLIIISRNSGFKKRDINDHCFLSLRGKGPFTPDDSVTVTVALTGGTFDVFDGNCHRQNGLHTHFSRYSDGDGVARCEQVFNLSVSPLAFRNFWDVYK